MTQKERKEVGYVENSAEVSKNRVDLYVEYGKSSKHSKQEKKSHLQVKKFSIFLLI